MGINRNMPKVVVSGPTWYGRLDIKELWMTKGRGHNKVTVSFLQKEDLVGEALQTELVALQLQSGVSWPILSRNGDLVCKYIPKCHASHTWAYNDKYNLSIEYKEDQWILPQCKHDKFIMEENAKLPIIKAPDLKYIQQCQIYHPHQHCNKLRHHTSPMGQRTELTTQDLPPTST